MLLNLPALKNKYQLIPQSVPQLPSLQSMAFSTDLISKQLKRKYKIVAYFSPYGLQHTR